MPLIKNGHESENTWTHVETGEPGDVPNGITVPLERLQADRERLHARNTRLGVRLKPSDDPRDLEHDLDRIDLIEIDFPKYTDGRGYSQASLLRRRMGYTGELRAVGNVLRDQLHYMARCGFDAFETERASAHELDGALRDFPAAYQPGADGARAIFQRRHAVTA